MENDLNRNETTFSDETYEQFKVQATTQVKKLAAAIVFSLRQKKRIYLTSVGAGAVNQAYKACAVARFRLSAENIGFYLIPAFDSQTPMHLIESNPELNQTVMTFYFRVYRDSDKESSTKELDRFTNIEAYRDV